MKHVKGIHQKPISKALQMSTHNICLCGEIKKKRKILDILLICSFVHKLTTLDKKLGSVNVLKLLHKCLTKWHMQTVQTLIRLLLKEQSDQGLHCLPFHLVFQETFA